MNRLFSFLDLSGKDTAAFLQGQLTQDVRMLPTAGGQLTAWCNAKGRVITIARLLSREPDGITLVVPRESAESICRRLALFRLRAEVVLEPADDAWRQAAVRSPAGLAELEAAGLLPGPGRFACRRKDGMFAFDTGAGERCIEVFGEPGAFETSGIDEKFALTDDEWRSALISAGVPHIAGNASERFTPHMLNLDMLGAVSFDKGCYTGQEVIARTRHLGQAKRRLMRYRLDGGQAVPGQGLQRDGANVGETVNAAGTDLLAVVSLECAGESLDAAGHVAIPVELPYAIPGVEPAT